MPETENGTSPDLLECIQNIPNSISVSKLRKMTQDNLDCLMLQYPKDTFPLLYEELQDLLQCSHQLDTTESDRGRMFWMLNIYLCFFASHNNPLFPPKNSERRKILGYLKNLKKSAS